MEGSLGGCLENTKQFAVNGNQGPINQLRNFYLPKVNSLSNEFHNGDKDDCVHGGGVACLQLAITGSTQGHLEIELNQIELAALPMAALAR